MENIATFYGTSSSLVMWSAMGIDPETDPLYAVCADVLQLIRCHQLKPHAYADGRSTGFVALDDHRHRQHGIDCQHGMAVLCREGSEMPKHKAGIGFSPEHATSGVHRVMGLTSLLRRSAGWRHACGLKSAKFDTSESVTHSRNLTQCRKARSDGRDDVRSHGEVTVHMDAEVTN